MNFGARLYIRCCQKGADVDFQAVGQCMQHRQRGIGQAGLDAAHIGAEQTAAVSQLLLGELELRSKLLDAQAQRFAGIDKGDCHPRTIEFVYSFIHTRIRTFAMLIYSERTRWNRQFKK